MRLANECTPPSPRISLAHGHPSSRACSLCVGGTLSAGDVLDHSPGIWPVVTKKAKKAYYIPFYSCPVLVSLDRNPNGVGATAVAAVKGGKVMGIVVTNAGSGYADVS